MAKQPKAKKGKTFKKQNSALPAEGMANDARYDMDTLTRAHEIRSNKSRMSAVQEHAKKQVSILSSVMGGARPRDEGEMHDYASKRRKKIT